MLRGGVKRDICFLITFAALSFSTAMAETITVLGDDKYLPVLYLDQSNKPAGILAGLLRKLAERTGDTYDFQLSAWSRAFERARNGEGAILGIAKTNDRLNLFDFSEPLYEDSVQIIVRKDKEAFYQTLSDLKGKVIGGLSGVSYGDSVDAAIENGTLSVQRSTELNTQFSKLLNGKIDAALLSNETDAPDWVLSSDAQSQAYRDEFVVLKAPLVSKWLYFAAAKVASKKMVIERLNSALNAMKKSGELKLFSPSRSLDVVEFQK